jgi:cell division protein FtsL
MSHYAIDSLSALFERRVRGFRLVEVVGLGVFMVLALTVYLLKAGAGDDRLEIARINRQILAEQTNLRVLRAEVAHLEQPERLGHLAEGYLGLAPIRAAQEISPEVLSQVAILTQPKAVSSVVRPVPVAPVAPAVGSDH